MSCSGLYQWFNRHYKQIWFLALLSLVLAGLVYGLSRLPLLRELEGKSLDLRFRLDPRPDKASRQIVLIAIDDGSLAFAREQLGQGWPWPRDFYAVVTDYLSVAETAATIFDISLEEADFYRGDIDSEAGDRSLAQALAGSHHSVLPLVFTHYDSPPESLTTSFALAVQQDYPAYQWSGLKLPYPLFTSAVQACGAINLLSSEDATVRKLPLIHRLGSHYYPSLALAALKPHLEESPGWKGWDSYLKSLPLDRDGSMHLNWYGKGGDGATFEYMPFSRLLSSAVAYEQGRIPELPASYFQDKYVIIGGAASGLLDLKASPYDWGIPGMEIWATQLSNLLEGDFLRFSDPWLAYLLLWVLSFLILLCVSYLRAGYSPFAVLLLLLLWVYLVYLSFREQRLVLDLSSMLLTGVVSWICILSLSYIMEGKKKQELKQIFDCYLHPTLVDQLLRNPQLTELGGKSYHATVIFSDIYNFTTYSEDKAPPQLVAELNDYFRSFTNSILDHNGLLDKYTGDGLMAIFGVPVERNDHALWACRAALAHRDYCRPFMGKLEAELSASEYLHLNTRLGICTGDLVAGNIGSKRRMEYTGIGDTVNLASRLEGVNKIFRTNIIISDSTYNLVKDLMLCRELDMLRVRGKNKATRIYELIAERSTVKELEYSWLGVYAEALDLYRRGLWAEAAEQFAQLTQDLPSRRMIKRCEKLLSEPPTQWEQIFPWEDEPWEEETKEK